MIDLDSTQLNFSPESLFFLNICLGFIMYGVALELKPIHFLTVIKHPKSTLAGLFSQFVLLPLLTYILVVIVKPMPSIALGMFLVAACPGGNISNFISLMAKGNPALSVSLTAISTLLAILMTPFNFAFWAGMYGPTASILQDISLNPADLLQTILLLLGLPLLLGMLSNHYLPKLTERILKPIKVVSLLIFAGFVGVAFASNFEAFTQYIQYVFGLVLLHNLVALGSGYGLGTLLSVSKADRRSLTIETGIQNSGLGLVLIFMFFGGLGGMAIITAWWGIWHILSGLSIAWFWSRKPLEEPTLNLNDNA